MTELDDARAVLAAWRSEWGMLDLAIAGDRAMKALRALADEYERLTAPPTDDEREAVAQVLGNAYSSSPYRDAHLRGADAILAAGFRRPGPVTDDEREAAIADRKAVLDVLNQGRGLPLDVVSAQVVMVLGQRGFRRPGPVTDAEVEAACNSWDPYFRGQIHVARMRAALEAARKVQP